MSTRWIEYGGQQISYRLERTDGESLAISVAPSGAVRVRAPHHADASAVDSRVRRRGRWILHQQRELLPLQTLSTKRRYVSGETYRYLGRQYRLRVRTTNPVGVRLIGGHFHVNVSNRKDHQKIKQLLDTWFREHAERVFHLAITKCLCAAPLRHLEIPPFALRSMQKRWGSCTKTGRILLNPLLVRVPRSCVEYVVAHELCHLVEHHHGPSFYRLLSRAMPDWEKRRRRLNTCEV